MSSELIAKVVLIFAAEIFNTFRLGFRRRVSTRLCKSCSCCDGFHSDRGTKILQLHARGQPIFKSHSENIDLSKNAKPRAAVPVWCGLTPLATCITVTEPSTMAPPRLANT